MVRSYSSINILFVVLIIVFLSLTWVRRADAELAMTEGEVGGLSCATCGNECAVLCSNRQSRLFRSCCMNFMRKRRSALNSNIEGSSSSSHDFLFPPSFYRFQ